MSLALKVEHTGESEGRNGRDYLRSPVRHSMGWSPDPVHRSLVSFEDQRSVAPRLRESGHQGLLDLGRLLVHSPDTSPRREVGSKGTLEPSRELTSDTLWNSVSVTRFDTSIRAGSLRL